jgi:hypothetical protein
MRCAFILATASLGLAGCGSMSIPGLDALRPTPPSMTLQLESLPSGAEARTSLGPSCRTPCAVAIPRTDNFTVTYTLDRYLPQTVPVRLIEPQILPTGSDDASSVQEATFEPSPVYVELQAAPPPRRPKAVPKAAPKAPPRSVTAPPPAAAPPPVRQPSSSPFPPPSSSPFPSPR